MGTARNDGQHIPRPMPFPAVPIDLERQTAASGSCNRSNLRTLQGPQVRPIAAPTGRGLPFQVSGGCGKRQGIKDVLAIVSYSPHWPGAANHSQWELQSVEPADAADKQTVPACQWISRSLQWLLIPAKNKMMDLAKLILKSDNGENCVVILSISYEEDSGLLNYK
ncbi:hypothetical protein UY3_13772 [Chelonia mydas]|uniref:Uncharacterized protein n=1 Tax=Chelonia mydas TaxID=8469 RepID=M7BLN9_CHEMY|nr:hypothetical protein UY3_13772 [Chelonia mydas]